jgi:hypothetical protein
MDFVGKKAHDGPTKMRDRESPGPERLLIYIPVVHTLADMGALGASVQKVKLSALGRQGVADNAAAVEKVWEAIERVATDLQFTPGMARVYQDGLPVCGHEQKIVTELAEAGSRNHRLLLRLQARGAILMGTESPEMLVEEYQATRAEFASGGAVRMGIRQKRLRDRLLERRDLYIADRINRTLGGGETGILFIGVLHNVSRYLDRDIKVVRPLSPSPS